MKQVVSIALPCSGQTLFPAGSHTPPAAPAVLDLNLYTAARFLGFGVIHSKRGGEGRRMGAVVVVFLAEKDL